MQLVVGRIGRAHGVRGDLFVEPFTDEPDKRFAPGAKLKTNDKIKVTQGKQSTNLIVMEDVSIPEGSIYIPSGIDETAHLSDIYGDCTVKKITSRSAS